MVWQHLYRVRPDGGETVAASAGLKGSAWLPLLEERMTSVGYADLPVPIFYQYPLGRGLVVSRCAPDPLSEEGAYLAHQIALDEMSDMEKLMRARPLSLSHFLPYYLESESGELTDLLPEALGDETERNDCLETLDRLLGGEEELLGRLLACLSLCARDKRQYIRVTMNDTLENVSLYGHQLMELLLSALPMEDALRLSFCTLQMPDSLNMQYTVCFSPDGGQALRPSPQEILVNLTLKTITAAQGIVLPAADKFLQAARSLLSHDVANSRRSVGKKVHSAADPLEMPPFERGMSIRDYFADWRSALDLRRSILSEEGVRTLATAEWPRLLGNIVAASELMEHQPFIIELSGILNQIRKEKLEDELALDADTLADMVIVLLDSIRWRQTDLTDPRMNRAIRNACAFATLLTKDQFSEDMLIACRVVQRLMTTPLAILDSLEDMDEIEQISRDQFDALQYCLKQYVQNRLTADIDIIDEQLAAAAMLGFVRFADGIPDLRQADLLTEKIGAQIGAASARRFQKMLDKLRHNLRSSHDGMMILRRRDMKLFLFISLLLIALIAGISIWFWLFG